MILILAWDVCFTQAQVWALAWEAGLVQEALALEVGSVLELELILWLDWEVDFFQALSLILNLVWEVGFFQVLDLILALAWEVGFFQDNILFYHVHFADGNMNPMSTIQVLFSHFF